MAITDLHIHQEFLESIKYHGKEGAQLIYTNMSGRSDSELNAEFNVNKKLRPKVKKVCWHVSINLPTSESLSHENWIKFADLYLKEMGFTENQFLVYHHSDVGHDHIHIIANRVTFSGGVVTDRNSFYRQSACMEKLEKEFGLQQVNHFEKADKHSPTKNELEKSVRTGQAPTRLQLQTLAEVAAENCASFSDYAERLSKLGVILIPTIQQNGAALIGLRYGIDGVHIKGSALGKSFTPMGLERRGITYEKNRDGETINRLLNNSKNREVISPASTGSEGHGADSASAIDFGASRGDSAGQTTKTDGTAIQKNRITVDHVTKISRTDQPAAGNSDEFTYSCDGVSNFHSDGNIRINDLAQVYLKDSNTDQKLSILFSRESIAAQFTSLKMEEFSVRFTSRETGKKHFKNIKLADVFADDKVIKYLRTANARGYDLSVTPPNSCIVLAGITSKNLEKMRVDGYSPSLVTQDRHGNYQVWIRFSDQQIDPAVQAIAAQKLTEFYSCVHLSDGALAGFDYTPNTNFPDYNTVRALVARGRNPVAGIFANLILACYQLIKLKHQENKTEGEATSLLNNLRTEFGSTDPHRTPQNHQLIKGNDHESTKH